MSKNHADALLSASGAIDSELIGEVNAIAQEARESYSGHLGSAAKAKAEPQRARLIGYANPLGLVPSFVWPVFEINNEPVLQECNAKGIIKSFYPFDPDSFAAVNLEWTQEPQRAEEGEEALYGFVFTDEEVVIGNRQLLVEKLLEQREALKKNLFLYTEVLEFLGKQRALDRALTKVEKNYADNEVLSKDWVASERKFLAARKGSAHKHHAEEAARGTVERYGDRAQKVGIVASDKMEKTVVVRVDRQVKHPKYRRYVRRTSKFMAHDETGAAVGDKVRIVETRPLSARKRWRVVEIVQKAAK